MIRKRFFSAAALAVLGLLAIRATAGAQEAPCPAPCPDACGRKVCVPTVEKKTVTKRVYSDTCEDFCLPRCSLLGSLFGGHGGCGECGDSGCAKCGHVRTKKYLVVRLQKEEKCETKCQVVQECCPAPACAAPTCAVPAPAPVPEMLPAPKK